MKYPILYIDHSPSHGGSIEALTRLVAALDKDIFYPVIVFAHPVSGRLDGGAIKIIPRRPSLSASRLAGRFVQMTSTLSRILSRLVSLMVYLCDLVINEFPYFIRLFFIARRHKIQLIHLNNNLNGNFAGIILSRLFKIPCISHHRDFEWGSPIIRWYANSVDYHIAISRDIRKNLLSIGVEDSKISTVHDPVSLDKFDPEVDIRTLEKDFFKGREERFFGIFGRVVKWKGHEVFLKAAAEVFKNFPNSRAFIVGDTADGNKEYLEELMRSAEELNILPKIVFTGFRNDVPAMMKLMDVVVHASTRPEPFGLVVIEAMAMKKPVVATMGGGPVEIVEDGKSGFLVPMEDHPKMAEAILGLLRSPQLAEQFGQRGREIVERQFSSKKCALKIQEIYKKFLTLRDNR